jgi:membrane protein implicated in regulation of membrane protease activity
VAFGLLVAELLTGTFYLLVIAIALAVAGIAALAGLSTPLQFVVAAAIGVGGSIWLRSTRFGRRLHERGDDRVQNMDIGQSLRVENWTTARTARANYRGAVWDVELAPGEQPMSGEFVIREIQANRLIVAAKPR